MTILDSNANPNTVGSGYYDSFSPSGDDLYINSEYIISVDRSGDLLWSQISTPITSFSNSLDNNPFISEIQNTSIVTLALINANYPISGFSTSGLESKKSRYELAIRI